MNLGLSGRKALIFGGSRGIGAATALALAEEGCEIAIVLESRGVDLSLCDSGDGLAESHALGRQVPGLRPEGEVGCDPASAGELSE